MTIAKCLTPITPFFRTYPLIYNLVMQMFTRMLSLMKRICRPVIPEGAILVTADIVGLYHSIPHEAGLKALREALHNRENKQIPTEKFLKMAEFVLKNNYFEFNGKVKKQLSGTAIGTTFAPTYTSIFMDKPESDFQKSQELTPLL